MLYGQSIVYFSRWLAEQDQPANLTSLTRQQRAEGGWESLRERGQNTGTIRTRWRGLRRFTTWLVAEEIIGTDPLAGIAVDKPEPPPVPILTDDELTALLDACKGRRFNDFRDAAMIRLFMDCGPAGKWELTGIDMADLELDGESVQVTGKGCQGAFGLLWGPRPAWPWIAT